MAYSEDRVNEFFNSRAFVVVMGIVFVVASYFAMMSGRFPSPDTGNGIFFSLKKSLIENATLSFGINVACTLLIAVLMIVLNKMYNFVRAVTSLYASAFLLLQLAFPFVCTTFNTGTAMCLVTVAAQFLLYATFQQRGYSQQRIFLIFAILATCCLFQWAFLVLIVAFFFGFVQMQAMSFRGILAMLFGIATPFWIAFGLGLVDPRTAMWPVIEMVWDIISHGQIQLVIAAVIVVAVLAIILIVMNIFKILNYRLQLRAYNSFYVVLTILAIVMMLIDYRNMMIYVPLLNYCLAIQIAQAFTINDFALRRYIFLFILITASVVTYAAHTFVL